MQNIIAIIWDFDKTLVEGYMQDPIFDEYQIESTHFWKEVNELPGKYDKEGVKVNQDTIYLNTFINKTADGTFKGLNNAKLRSYGAKQKFYPGVPEIFEKTLHLFDEDTLCKEYNIRVEHYIVSTGFAEVIRGTILQEKEYIKKIWGCELIEHEHDGVKEIAEIGYTIDNTSKTRALFEINKGEDADVNSKMTAEQRRVDFRNMIYIADGPSDVPAFSVVRKNGGATFAVYPKGNSKAFQQVEQLRVDGRIDMFAEADYSDKTTASMWICNKIQSFADRIKSEEKAKREVKSRAPRHLA